MTTGNFGFAKLATIAVLAALFGLGLLNGYWVVAALLLLYGFPALLAYAPVLQRPAFVQIAKTAPVRGAYRIGAMAATGVESVEKSIQKALFEASADLGEAVVRRRQD